MATNLSVVIWLRKFFLIFYFLTGLLAPGGFIG